MGHIFRFHQGTNNNIIDWKQSDRISAGSLDKIADRSVVIDSNAGTSIPTPLARLFLFKTAFTIVSKQLIDNNFKKESIYAGLVSETLDLLELLYMHGADGNKFRYKKWVFENNDATRDFFGTESGHKLLAKSFEQAANQVPFNKKIEITLIFYKENGKEVLLGGTSPFTFVFTAPNFKAKLNNGKYNIPGLRSGDKLFDSSYLQIYERDASFVKYIESLHKKVEYIPTFKGFNDYVSTSNNVFPESFNGIATKMQDIKVYDQSLVVSDIPLQQITTASVQETIADNSDFKLLLSEDSPYKLKYKNSPIPLLLKTEMELGGQYTSKSNLWNSNTKFNEITYPENTLERILQRELPVVKIKYPFLSEFDFFEDFIISLPGYKLNDERFVTLTAQQGFLFPIKPLFFQFFPLKDLSKYLKIESDNKTVKCTLTFPIFGPTKHNRLIVFERTYAVEEGISYSGILGIFPFTKASQQELLHINDYTVASYEKTNTDTQLNSLKFLKSDGADGIHSIPNSRSNYSDIKIKSTYYQVHEGFELMQLNFKRDNVTCGGMIIPKFNEVVNGDSSYVFAIDFGTSNTHIEFGRVNDDDGRSRIAMVKPFGINKDEMQMYLLHKPTTFKPANGAPSYLNYEDIEGQKIDAVRQITLREFMPFQIGSQAGTSIKFPFRTALAESNSFISSITNKRLFIDASIGFNIDSDLNPGEIRYKTDLKWLLQNASEDQFNVNRVKLFARQLMLMIRTKVLLGDEGYRGHLNKIKVILSFPISMGQTLKNKLSDIFEDERKDIFGVDSLELLSPVTESIAPYYFLKSQNFDIQSNNFCNIDIGGGTTDIVITNSEKISQSDEDKNTLECFCASFRFAGRQLWSSGANDFNKDDNGFVSYYKDFRKKANMKTEGDLERIFTSNSLKTEDVVGILFSNPAYNFKDIFSHNHEFKVVPLIHYAAIIYYIVKLSEWKKINLPRTISFSGKGSEYLNLLFSYKSGTSDQDLVGLTKNLVTMFTDVTMNPNFKLKRAEEPKVITAKGAVHYAVENIVDDESSNVWGVSTQANTASDKVLKKIDVVFMGFKDVDFESPTLTYGDFLHNKELFNNIMDNVINFLDLLFGSQSFNGAINKKLEIRDFSAYRSFFLPNGVNVYEHGILRDSFRATLETYPANGIVSDSPFFFALNYTLTELSKFIDNKAKGVH